MGVGKFTLTLFNILLARLLGPHQFGTAAAAMVALLAVLSFNELGVSLAIVRWPGEPGEIAPTVTTISVASSSLLYVALFLSAPAFASAMGAPAATSVIRVLDLSLVTNGIVAVPAALLERYFLQGRKTIADQVHAWSGATVSVALAWAGFGAMSLALGQVVGAIAGGAVIVKFSPLPLRFGFNRALARKLLRFGLPLAGSSFIVFLIANIDNLVTGHVLGVSALGFYVLAWNLASMPVNVFSQPVRNVAPALFSRLQHDPTAMRTGFASATALLGAVTLPICLLMSGAAVPLITFIYGPKWVPAAQALFWLAMLAALRIFFELTYDYFVVLARSRVVFTVQLVWLLALFPLLIVGARLRGIGGVALAGLLVAAVVVLPWYLIELSKVGIKARTIAARLWLPLVVAVGVGAIAWASAQVIHNAFWACVVGGVTALTAVGLLGLRMRPVLAELRPTLAVKEGTESSTTAAGSIFVDSAATVRRGTPAAQAAGVKALLALAASAPWTADGIHLPAVNAEPDTIVNLYHNVIPQPSVRTADESRNGNHATEPSSGNHATEPSSGNHATEPSSGNHATEPSMARQVSGRRGPPYPQILRRPGQAGGNETFVYDWPTQHGH
jgi:PST family polysaccharide transporter